jgi:hypothetical protein
VEYDVVTATIEEILEERQLREKMERDLTPRASDKWEQILLERNIARRASVLEDQNEERMEYQRLYDQEERDQNDLIRMSKDKALVDFISSENCAYVAKIIERKNYIRSRIITVKKRISEQRKSRVALLRDLEGQLETIQKGIPKALSDGVAQNQLVILEHLDYTAEGEIREHVSLEAPPNNVVIEHGTEWLIRTASYQDLMEREERKMVHQTTDLISNLCSSFLSKGRGSRNWRASRILRRPICFRSCGLIWLKKLWNFLWLNLAQGANF